MLERTGINEIKKGVKIVKDLSSDALIRERVRARENAIRDYDSAMNNAIKRGMKQGTINRIRIVMDKDHISYDKAADLLYLTDEEREYCRKECE